MQNNILHPEITCPYCRIQFGSYKFNKQNNKLTHIDIMWSNEYGLIRDCWQQEFIMSQTEKVDPNGNLTFNSELETKISELREKFENDPTDIDKNNFSFDEYHIAFCECMNWGNVDGDEEEYDRENLTGEKLKDLYENGCNLKEALKYFLIVRK